MSSLQGAEGEAVVQPPSTSTGGSEEPAVQSIAAFSADDVPQDSPPPPPAKSVPGEGAPAEKDEPAHGKQAKKEGRRPSGVADDSAMEVDKEQQEQPLPRRCKKQKVEPPAGHASLDTSSDIKTSSHIKTCGPGRNGFKVGGINIEADSIVKLVEKYGGYNRVSKQKLWAGFAEQHGVDLSKCPRAAFLLKRAYMLFTGDSGTPERGRSPEPGCALSQLARVADLLQAAEEGYEEHTAKVSSASIDDVTEGWVAMDLPKNVAFRGVPDLCEDTARFLRGKTVACKFVDGWKRGTVHKKQETSRKNMGLFAVKVKGVRGYLLYDLKRDTYKKEWVLLEERQG